MTAVEFCDISGVNRNDRFVILKKYGRLDKDLKGWKGIVKDDFRSVKIPNLPEAQPKAEKVQKSNKKENK